MIAWTASTVYAVTIVSGKSEFEKELHAVAVLRCGTYGQTYVFDIKDATKVRRILDKGEEQSFIQNNIPLGDPTRVVENTKSTSPTPQKSKGKKPGEET